MKSKKPTFFLLVIYWLVCLYATRVSAQQVWAFEQVSTAIYQLNESVTQRFSTSEITQPPSTEHKLKTILVQIMPSTGAFLESYLCVRDTDNCVPIQGGRLYTQAFNQYNAQSQLLVVHRIRDWKGTLPPLFVKTQLNIWWE